MTSYLWKNEGDILDFEINVRAMMAALYCGTGGEDIVNVGSFLSIPGGKSWGCSFPEIFLYCASYLDPL